MKFNIYFFIIVLLLIGCKENSTGILPESIAIDVMYSRGIRGDSIVIVFNYQQYKTHVGYADSINQINGVHFPSYEGLQKLSVALLQENVNKDTTFYANATLNKNVFVYYDRVKKLIDFKIY